MSKYIHQQQIKINDLQVKISELKAENERLKKYETIYYLNQLQASNEDIDKFKQNQIQQSINISYLLKDNTKQVCEKIEKAFTEYLPLKDKTGAWFYGKLNEILKEYGEE